MNDKRVFVLVHGMWHGGWCWKKVSHLLRMAGHEVYAPTLTGLGERVHLRREDIDLNFHIQDVLSLFDYENLRDAILVGHSLGGFMAPLIADKIPERIAHIVNLDGPIPENGKAPKDLIGETWDFFKQNAAETGDEWWCPPIKDWTFGVSGADLEWMQSKLTPHPLKTLTTIVSLENPHTQFIPRTFILCSEGLSENEITVEEQKFTNLGWNYWSLPTGHDAMITTPEELTNILLELAKGNP